MTPWSPFSGAPMDGVEIRTHNTRCYICGELLRKGERALRARQQKRDIAAAYRLMYPTHDGSTSLKPTYRHPTCAPG